MKYSFRISINKINLSYLTVILFAFVFAAQLQAQCTGPDPLVDCDDDGTINIDDDDDDNDGILDVIENICTPSPSFDFLDPSDIANPSVDMTNSSTLVTLSGQSVIWETAGAPPSRFHGINNNNTTTQVRYASTNNGAGTASPTATDFDVTVRFPQPVSNFQILAIDLDASTNPSNIIFERLQNFSIEPTALTLLVSEPGNMDPFINAAGQLIVDGNNNDVLISWELDNSVTELTFALERNNSGRGLSFEVGFNGLCDVDGDGIGDIFDTDSDNDGHPDSSDPNRIVPMTASDTGSVGPGSTVSIDILANDDYLSNNDRVGLTNFAEGTTTITDTGNGTAGGTITFDADTGEVIYTALASEAGESVTIEYEVCNDVDSNSPGITADDTCETALITITVSALQIIATNDTGGSFASEEGGTTATVFGNDTLNGTPFTNTEVIPSILNDQGTGITINTDGTLSIPVDVDPGPYMIEYQICEVSNTASCDTAIVAITITSNAIIATNDTAGSFVSEEGGTTTTVFGNDTLDGTPFESTEVIPSILNDQGTGITINTDGTLSIPVDVIPGSYMIEYQICEASNIANCDTAIVSVTISPCPSSVDTDGDGLTDCEETTGIDDPSTPGIPNNPTDPLNPCDDNGDVTDGDITNPIFADADCDGDGVTNENEVLDNTNPLSPCDFVFTSQDLEFVSEEWLALDCDGDSILNGDELGDEDNSGIPDFLEPAIDIEVFEGMSPNGDNRNDVFVIRGIEQFPDNTVRIFNRWGVEVFMTEGYGQDGNEFTGESNGRGTISTDAQLPTGTYFYVLEYIDNQDQLQQLVGSLYINR